METVDVMVRCFDRGRQREVVVPVEEECFTRQCWKPIACIRAAVALEMSFTDLERNAHYGLRAEDLERLRAMAREQQ